MACCCRSNLGRIIGFKNDHQNCMIIFVFVKMLKRVKLSMWIKLQGAGNIKMLVIFYHKTECSQQCMYLLTRMEIPTKSITEYLNQNFLNKSYVLRAKLSYVAHKIVTLIVAHNVTHNVVHNRKLSPLLFIMPFIMLNCDSL